MKELWVCQMPADSYTREVFPPYTKNMWDYECRMHFAKRLHLRKDAVRTYFLVGIRTRESSNRWCSIHLNRKYQMYRNYRWTSKIGNDIYNTYPTYDQGAADIRAANGKFGSDYNHSYDLCYKADVNIERQHMASPLLCEAQESLALYKAIDPDTRGKTTGRVNGVNFAGIYGGTHTMGWRSVRIPERYTWKSFMQFLFSTLPEETRRSCSKKLTVSIKFRHIKGERLLEGTVKKLQDTGVSLEVANHTNYRTDKKPARMGYLGGIDTAEFQKIPTHECMCICILKNDYTCKYMGSALAREEIYKRGRTMEQFENMML